MRDIFTPVQFEVSYSHKETHSQRGSSKTFPALKPILQQSAGHQTTISNQVLLRSSIRWLPASADVNQLPANAETNYIKAGAYSAYNWC